MLTAAEIRSALLSRGTQLNSPASESEIRGLELKLGIKLDDYIASIYRAFNGFEEGEIDARSKFSIWPLTHLTSKPPGRMVTFGDFLVRSDDLLFDPSDARVPVTTEAGKEVIASSAPQFWDNLVSGQYDF